MVLFQNVSEGSPNSVLQVAVKNNQQPVWYFTDKIPLQALFVEDGKMERGAFLEVTFLLHTCRVVCRALLEFLHYLCILLLRDHAVFLAFSDFIVFALFDRIEHLICAMFSLYRRGSHCPILTRLLRICPMR